MARSKSDIANSGIRIFLQKVGAFYDKARRFEEFRPTKSQKRELLEFFNGRCCYCYRSIELQNLSQDHLIPMNKEHLGLHAWGNVVPCCTQCNNDKHQKPWRDFLRSTGDGSQYEQRANLIEEFVRYKNYDPNLKLGDYAGNLYEDIGEVAMTLIDLRYKQAQEAIRRIVGDGGT